jgi:hypothetical protein
MATESLPPCIFTECFSCRSSLSAHVPARPSVRTMLRFKALCHLLRHKSLARPGTSTATATQHVMGALPRFFLHRDFVVSLCSTIYLFSIRSARMIQSQAARIMIESVDESRSDIFFFGLVANVSVFICKIENVSNWVKLRVCINPP